MTAWDLWIHRNGIQEEVLKASRRAANRPIIEEENGLGSIGMAGYDHCLFNKTLLKRLTEDLNKQDAWIRRVQSAHIRAAASIPVRRRAAVSYFRATLARLGHTMRPAQFQDDDTAQPTTERGPSSGG